MANPAVLALLLAIVACDVRLAAANCAIKPPDVKNIKSWPDACNPVGGVPTGYVCTATCKDWYTSLPAPTSTCLSSGQWSTPTTYCKPTCKGMPSLVVPGVTWSPSCADSTLRDAPGNWCNGICAAGTSGAPKIKCGSPVLVGGVLSSGWTTTTEGKCVPGIAYCASKPSTAGVTNIKQWPNSCIGAAPGEICTAECNANSVYWYFKTGYPQVKCMAPTGPPVFLGCFAEPACGSSSLTVLPSNVDMTLEVCAGLAAAAGYKYMGLQQGSMCLGSNDVSAYTTAGTCDIPCQDNDAQTCGGLCANSIYALPTEGTWSTPPYPAKCEPLKVQYMDPKCMPLNTFCTVDADCCTGLTCQLTDLISPVTNEQQKRCLTAPAPQSAIANEPGLARGGLVPGDAGIVPAGSSLVTPAAVVEEAGPGNGRRLKSFGGV